MRGWAAGEVSAALRSDLSGRQGRAALICSGMWEMLQLNSKKEPNPLRDRSVCLLALCHTEHKRLWTGALTSAGESVCLSKYLGHLRRLWCAYMSVCLTIGWFLWSGPPSELHSPFYQPAPSSHPPAACWSCSSSHTWWLAAGMRTNVGGGEHAIKHNIVKCQIIKLSKSNAW